MPPPTVLSKEFVFIIGSPRSGTTWLHAMLAEHPMVCSTAGVELTLFSRYISAWTRAWHLEQDNMRKGRWVQGLPHLWDESDFEESLRSFLVRAYGSLLRSNASSTHILDKQPNYSFHLVDIDRLVPNFRLIHVIRDGRDAACSMVNTHKKLGFGAKNIRQAAREWQRYYEAARQGRRFGDRYMEVRYEDLLDGGAAVLQRIFDFCGLDVELAEAERILRANDLEAMRREQTKWVGKKRSHAGLWKGRAGHWRESLTPLQRYAFHWEAGRLLVALGYAEPGWWVRHFWQPLTLPLLLRLRWSLWHRLRRTGAELLGFGPTKVLLAKLKAMRERLASQCGKYRCSVCASRVRTFTPLPAFYRANYERYGAPDALENGETCNADSYSCPFCLASDRERLYCLYLREHLAEIVARPDARIMHFAPARALRAFIERQLVTHPGVTYVTADLSMPNVDLKVDLTDLHSVQDESLDFFICSHVLEHVPEDRRALEELCRVLRPGGQGILMVPISLAATEIDEDPTVTDEAERWRRFGQHDHVRLYSRQGFMDRVASVGFHLEALGTEHFGEETFKQHGINPQSVLYVVHKPERNGEARGTSTNSDAP